MIKPEKMLGRKNSLRRYMEETLRGNRLKKREAILFRVTPESVIINKIPLK